MNSGNFFAELKRRNVYKVAVAYAVVAWLLIQIATQTFPLFEIPNWAVRLVILLVITGLPIALVFAWAYELTPEGIKRTEDVAPHESITRTTGRKLDFLIIGVLLVVIALLVVDRFRHPPVPAASNVSEKSIAVLPFENLSDDKQNAYFTDGVQEEILTDLAKIADLKVISRISVMEYRNAPKRNVRDIGAALRVAHVLEGSVQRIGGRLRVTAQLIDARTDAHLWAEHYDREIADLFEIQTEIAEKIATRLEAKLSPAEKASIDEPPTGDLVAYDAYLRAKELINSEQANWEHSLREAERLLGEAVRADPRFLLAHCALARVHDRLFEYGIDRSNERLGLANVEVQIASELNPDAGETHLARARHYQTAFHDNDRAKNELTLAARTLPNNVDVLQVLANIQRCQGNWDEAARNLEKAVSLAPRSFEVLQDLAATYRPMHRYRELRQTFERERAIPSAEFTARWSEAWVSLEESADPRPARMLLSEASKRSGSERELLGGDALFLALLERDRPAADTALALMPKEGVTSILGPCPYAFYQGLAATCSGDWAGVRTAYAIARLQVEAVVRANPDYAQALSLLALIDAGLGRKDDAIVEGRRAIELLPVSKDAVAGANALFYLSVIYSQLKEDNLAIDQLEKTAKLPYAFTSYGWLKLLPIFDPLRGNPRFEKIVASLAPKE